MTTKDAHARSGERLGLIRPLLPLVSAGFFLISAFSARDAAAQVTGLPNVTVPLDSQVRFTPESEWDGITVVPVGEEVWEKLYLVHQSRYQVVAILPGNVPNAGLEGPGVDLLSPQPMGPPAPQHLFSPVPQKRGWPVRFAEGSSGPATPVDLGGEVGLAVGSPSGLVYLLDPAGQKVSGWPVQMDSPISSPISVGDLDGDGHDDLVLACTDGSLHALSQTGKDLEGWPVKIPGIDAGDHIRGCPTVADLDGDGVAEVVAATRMGFVAAWSCRGSLAGPLWPMRVPAGTDPVNDPGIHSSPAVVDLDGDGMREVIVGTCAYNVWAWHSDGRPLSGWPVRVPGKARAGFSSPVIGDLNGDRRPDVVVGTDLGFEGGRAKILAVDAAGDFLEGWPVDSPERVNAAPALADLNGDGHPEVVAATVGGDGSLLVLDGRSGQPLPGWPVAVSDLSFNSSPIIVDVDGDGAPNIVAAGSEAGFTPRVKIVAYDIGGNPAPGWPITLDAEEILTSSPWVADLEGDGLLELVMATEADGRLYVWELPTADHPGAAPWPIAQGDPGRTGEWRLAPQETPISPPRAPEIRSPRVDLENPLMTISFSLFREESVELSIFNIMGQRVRRLLDHELPPGQYDIVWDAMDDAGRLQQAGIYFYELRIGTKSASQQMLLLK